MDQLSSGIPTAEATAISSSEAAALPLAEAYVVSNNLRLQPGTFGATTPAASSSAGMTNDELRARRLEYYQPNAVASNQGDVVASNNGPFDDELPIATPIETVPSPIAIPLSDGEMFRADVEAGQARRSRESTRGTGRALSSGLPLRQATGRMEGTSGSTEVSITRLDLSGRARMIAAINVARERMSENRESFAQHSLLMAEINVVGSRVIEDRQPGAIKRAVKDVTADPLFQQELEKANAKGLKAYELYSASKRTYEAAQKEQIQDTSLPQQQQSEELIKPGKSTVSSSDERETTLSVKAPELSASDAVDGEKKIGEQHQEILQAGKREDDKAAEKKKELEEKQQNIKLAEREAQLANMANPLVLA